MNYLREIGATEQLASGIRTIKYELREAGLQEPTFANISSSFVATIFYSAFISQDDKAWMNQFSGYKLNERQRAGLTALKRSKEGMSNSEYRQVNGMNRMGDDKSSTYNTMSTVVNGGAEAASSEPINCFTNTPLPKPLKPAAIAILELARNSYQLSRQA